jgi:hypothetical protein
MVEVRPMKCFFVYFYLFVVVILNLEEKYLNTDFSHDAIGDVVFVVLTVDVEEGGGF